VEDAEFQTYPRGVEVRGRSASSATASSFQTYPRGVEVRASGPSRASSRRFRRTLVGLKYDEARQGAPTARVSDVPSWG